MFGYDVFGSPTLLKKSEMNMNVNYDDQTPCQKYCTENYGAVGKYQEMVDCWEKCEENADWYKVNEMGNQSWIPSTSDSVAHPATEDNKKSTKSSSKEESQDSNDSNEPDEAPEASRYAIVVLGICAMAGIWALEQKEQFISKMLG